MVNPETLIDHQQLTYPEVILRLLQRYPDTPVLQVEQPTDEQNFAKQKVKRHEYPIEGGAIGIISMPDSRIILAKRSGPNSGWALPGGRVEIGEEFDGALVREVLEETGVSIAIKTLLIIEHKTFISPSSECQSIWLSVFSARTMGESLPYQTEDAIKEGLEIGTFHFDSLPQDMLHSDKQKIIQYFK